MNRTFYFQSFPDIIFDETGKVIRELIGGFDRVHTCEYINDVYEKDDLFITNNSAYFHYIKDRCHVKCKYEEFKNRFQPKIKEPQKRQFHKYKSLDDKYIFKFGKFNGKCIKDVPDWYIEWFKVNVPKSKW